MNGHEVKMLNLATLQPHGKAAALRDMVQSRRETQADKIRAWEVRTVSLAAVTAEHSDDSLL